MIVRLDHEGRVMAWMPFGVTLLVASVIGAMPAAAEDGRWWPVQTLPPLLLHGLAESQVHGCVALLREKLAQTTPNAKSP